MKLNNQYHTTCENVYITKSKFQSITRSFSMGTNGCVPQNIYERDLTKILSRQEITWLSVYQILCENPDEVFQKYTRVETNKSRSRMLFVHDSNAYHCSPQCDAIKQDYINFEIPPEILNRNVSVTRTTPIQS